MKKRRERVRENGGDIVFQGLMKVYKWGLFGYMFSCL
jgi:hypothetical protein